VVVLPTPPFPEVTTMTLELCCSLECFSSILSALHKRISSVVL
jgi:hypothetical protein